MLEDLAFVSSVLCFRCSHFSLFLLSSVRVFVCILFVIAFSLFSVPGGDPVVPGGSFGRPWKCLGSCRGFLVGPWDILNGCLGAPWGVVGSTWGCLWDPEVFLVGPRGVLGAA